MKRIKIIFFGTPDFAVKSLKVINDNFDILCVVTSPDKKSGRGLKINESRVKRFSSENNIPVQQPEELTNKDFISEISSLCADLFIVVAFRKLPKEVFSIPLLGTINLHASLLPNYRGAAPINWVLINNERVTGVTTFFINERIDYGDIILQEEVIITNDDNFETLYNKLSIIGSKVLLKTIEIVASGKAQILKQDESKDLKKAPKLNSNNTRINWNDNIDKIIGMIRGLSPKPGSWTNLKNGDKEIRVKILKANLLSRSNLSNTSIGKVLIIKDEIHINLKDGVINCSKIQLENKKEMLAKDLLNGYKFYKNSHVY
ncbi:MAG: methionyl-tRNA formyltransferase [Bacteroidetes bacterium]|nr:methionyl-tRNA formyltransferase [Bacteroidota bacterium]